MENYKTLCRVCLRKDFDEDQITYLNTKHFEKLSYIGDSSEVVQFVGQPVPLCVKCDIKLDLVYEYIVNFNNSKAKLRELSHNYDPYQVVDLNLEAIDYTEEEGSAEFVNIVKIEMTVDSRTMCETWQNGELNGVKTEYCKSGLKHTSPFSPRMNHIKSTKSKRSTPNQKKIRKRSKRSKPDLAPTCHLSVEGCDGADGASPSDVSSICYICAKKFSTRANMLRHVRKHLGRRFICEYEGCESYFTQKSSLQVHIARHKGLKPYECELCGKKFSQSKSLVFHRRVHTGESPYECDYCEKKFKQKSNLIRHFKCHRKPSKPRQKRFSCPKCEKYLASKQSLLRHLDRHERIIDVVTKIEAIKIEQNLFAMN